MMTSLLANLAVAALLTQQPVPDAWYDFQRSEVRS
jgi:hypothetical protein